MTRRVTKDNLTSKEVHVRFDKPTFVGVKIVTFERDLSFQDLLCGFARLIADGDSKAIKIADEIAMAKYEGTLKSYRDHELTEVDRDLLYSIMERNSPLNKDTGE